MCINYEKEEHNDDNFVPSAYTFHKTFLIAKDLVHVM